MEKLNFYLVDNNYLEYLRKTEFEKRGASKIPYMEYAVDNKPKFLCGIILKIEDMDYYAPVTSFKEQKKDNFLIKSKNGAIVSSLRFNYMFPIPKELVSIRKIEEETDQKYKSLLSQELRFCIKNQDEIQLLAERTYRRVLMGKDKGLVCNSCDFRYLEEKCRTYIQKVL